MHDPAGAKLPADHHAGDGNVSSGAENASERSLRHACSNRLWDALERPQGTCELGEGAVGHSVGSVFVCFVCRRFAHPKLSTSLLVPRSTSASLVQI